eukprot:SM000107S14084  [mRNA]  locus=s107:320042:322010:+ [translate_table: standard]
MCFVDFSEKQQATTAMWSTNGHKLSPTDGGLLVSYDKVTAGQAWRRLLADAAPVPAVALWRWALCCFCKCFTGALEVGPRSACVESWVTRACSAGGGRQDDSEERGGWSVRKQEEEKRLRREVNATRVAYHCRACQHFCFKLGQRAPAAALLPRRRSALAKLAATAPRVAAGCSSAHSWVLEVLRNPRPLEEMPERRTDASRVVDAKADLVFLACAKGAIKLLKREKGVERQFRYNCELCDVCVGYRSTPFEDEAKIIYVFPETSATVKDTCCTLASALTLRRQLGLQAVATKIAVSSQQSEGDAASSRASAGGGPASGVGAGPRQDTAAESARPAQAEGGPLSAQMSGMAEEEGSGIAAGSGGLAVRQAAEDPCGGADTPCAPLELVPSPLPRPPPSGDPDPQLA